MDAINCKNNVKGIVYSCDSYYSYYSYYSYFSRKVMGLDSYLDFEATRDFFEQ